MKFDTPKLASEVRQHVIAMYESQLVAISSLASGRLSTSVNDSDEEVFSQCRRCSQYLMQR